LPADGRPPRRTKNSRPRARPPVQPGPIRWHRRQRRETAQARRSWPQATRISANLPAPVARPAAFPERIATMSIVIGTRGSALALAQARIAADRLDGPVELRVIRTAGDATAAPIAALGDGVLVDPIRRPPAHRELHVPAPPLPA